MSRTCLPGRGRPSPRRAWRACRARRYRDAVVGRLGGVSLLVAGLWLTLSLLTLSLTPLPVVAQSPAETLSLLRTARGAQPARLIDWQSDAVRFEVASGASQEDPPDEVQLPLSAAWQYGEAAPARGGGGVVLADGSLLVGRIIQIDAESVMLRSEYFTVSLPATLVRAVHWHAPDLVGLRRGIVTAALAAPESDDESGLDQVWTVDGDRLRGTLTAGRDGFLWPTDGEEALRLRAGELERRVETARVRGVIFSPLLAPRMPAEDSRPVRVHLADGSWLEVAAVRVLAGEAWRFRLACGVDLIARQPEFSAAEIVAVRSPGAGAAEDASAYWLGEATPLRVVRVPLIGEPQASAERRGWSAPRLLEHEGRLRIWPIAMRAGTQAVYRLPSREGGVLRFALGGMAADGEGPLREGELRFRVQSVRSSGALQVLWQRDWSAVAAGDASGIVEIKLPPGPAIVLEVLRPRGRAAAAVGLWIDPVVWGP